jgi:hypothetical protein
MTTSTEPTDVGASSAGTLKANVLGLFDSIVMAVAGSAPAYTIAGSTAVLVGAVAFAGPVRRRRPTPG